jgi:hypothetical protein
MEVDFDKEIDALLRKTRRDAPVLVGDFTTSRHLDADEISAFAENAMPENSRALYTAHMADCDRCRKILSDVLIMNSAAAPATAAPGVITIAQPSIPWYKQLFLFPNLAYVMGGLVLVFGGFLAFTIMQNPGRDNSDVVFQASESRPSKGGPNVEDTTTSPDAPESTNMSANSAANMTAANDGLFAANANSSAAPVQNKGGGPGPRVSENNFLLDGVDSSADTTAAAAPPPSVSTQSLKDLPVTGRAVGERDDLAKEKAENKAAAGAVVTQESAKTDSVSKQQQYPGTPSQSGPMRNNENQYNRQLENMDARSAAKKRAVAREEESSSGRKVVGGKTFERKQNVWYDTTFQGRPTINVRRGTDEFNKLDSGLRSIANSLGGTIVVVWGAKAYRIQ